MFGPAEQDLKPLAQSAPAAIKIKFKLQEAWEGIVFSFLLDVTEMLSGAHDTPAWATFSPYSKGLAADT